MEHLLRYLDFSRGRRNFLPFKLNTIGFKERLGINKGSKQGKKYIWKVKIATSLDNAERSVKVTNSILGHHELNNVNAEDSKLFKT